jgi:hypothetical protein
MRRCCRSQARPRVPGVPRRAALGGDARPRRDEGRHRGVGDARARKHEFTMDGYGHVLEKQQQQEIADYMDAAVSGGG